jgi:hypothetical protein
VNRIDRADLESPEELPRLGEPADVDGGKGDLLTHRCPRVRLPIP